MHKLTALSLLTLAAGIIAPGLAAAWESDSVYGNTSQIYTYGPGEQRTQVHETTSYGPWERVPNSYVDDRNSAWSPSEHTHITWYDEPGSYNYYYHRDEYREPQVTTWRRVIRKERWWEEREPRQPVVIVNNYETRVTPLTPKKLKAKKKIIKRTETTSVVKCECH